MTSAWPSPVTSPVATWTPPVNPGNASNRARTDPSPLNTTTWGLAPPGPAETAAIGVASTGVTRAPKFTLLVVSPLWMVSARAIAVVGEYPWGSLDQIMVEPAEA